MSQDGHIASLFPGNSVLQENSRSVVPVVGPISTLNRLTIAPLVIHSAKSTFLFVIGKEKGRILAQALKSPNNIALLPVRLVLGTTWVLDSDATEQINNMTLND